MAGVTLPRPKGDERAARERELGDPQLVDGLVIDALAAPRAETAQARSFESALPEPKRTSLRQWFDSWSGMREFAPSSERKIDWLRALPFLAMHLSLVALFWVGWSWTAVLTAAGLYVLRMFAITGFYHRYFSHRSFKTSRWFQFVIAVIGNSSVQRGPLWWAANHRHHHHHSDEEQDLHSPVRTGFLYSHFGWFTNRQNVYTKLKLIPDFAKFPELRLLDRFDLLVPLLGAAGMYVVGALLERFAPGLGTTGGQMLTWSIISTVALAHGTFTINSLSHMYGKRRYETSDTSRNNWFLALLTMGEGWHNNHHGHQHSARQGFFWWEIDLTYYGLVALKWLGLVWDLRPVPQRVLDQGRRRREPS